MITLKLSRESKTRQCVREELDQKISDLIQRLNWLIVDIEGQSGKQIVVIVDDLDKITRGQQSEDFFYKNYPLLLQPDCFVVYTFPIPLAFNPYYENVRHAFSGDVTLLQVPIKDRHGNTNRNGIEFYETVIKRRLNPDLLEDNVLKEAIESTGKLSELVEVMREASLKAFRMSRERITIEDVKSTLEKLRITYDRTLTEAHKKKLLEIDSCREGRDEDTDSNLIRDLLFSLTAVEYEDREGRWCSINAMLLPLVDKWSRST